MKKRKPTDEIFKYYVAWEKRPGITDYHYFYSYKTMRENLQVVKSSGFPYRLYRVSVKKIGAKK